HLANSPGARYQGQHGDSWQWAGTGVMEIALKEETGVSARLSVQFINSCNTRKNCCDGGWLQDVVDFYGGMGFALPWSNANAQYSSYGGTCGSAPCGAIATTPNYPITSISLVQIPTTGVGQAQAIANLKNTFDQGKAIWLGFFL